MWLQVMISLLLIQGIVTQAVTLVARVSVGEVKGTVTFTQANPDEATTMNISLSGAKYGELGVWQLHPYRLNYDVMDRCAYSQVGTRILGSAGGPVSDGVQTVQGLKLSGMDSVEGRSIVFLDDRDNPIACATVESPDEYITARATFRKTVLGQVIFRQQRASSSALTRVTLDLYSDGSASSAREVEWRVVDDGGCSTVGQVFNPGSVTGTCDNNNHSSCAVGDLTGKLGKVTVAPVTGGNRWTSLDLNLPLSGSASVLGKSLQLFATGQSSPLACAPIYAYASRTGRAIFDNDGVTGTITLTQPSPLDPTTTSVDLQNLRSLAGGYHVHKYPVPQRLSKDQSVLCSGDSVSGHFNPFGVVYNANSPEPAASTEDMYEVGDLSKKYGLLNGLDSRQANYIDFNLPLFGPNSVLGRSLVIHYDRPGGPRWICSNIQDTAALTSALATFTFPVIGHVLLQQRVVGEGEGVEEETTVYYRLDYGDGVSEPSSGHSWALHGNAVGEDALTEDVGGRCASAGDVIDPYGVSDTDYAVQCQPSNPWRCRSGDLKGKLGAVSIRAGPSIPAIGFFTGVNLPLQGPNSVVGKLVVLKAEAGAAGKLACAKLFKVWPQVLEAKAWGQGANFGSLTLSQQVGVVQVPTRISVELQALSSHDQIAVSVNSKPVNAQDPANRCSRLGGVYNPFEVSSSGSTKDSVPVGDLTAKFRALSTGGGASMSDLILMDPSLDVWGPRGVGGRALSLKASPSMASIGCADLLPKREGEGKMFTARAVFTGNVTGNITMMQYMYREGAMTPTTVIVDLRKASGAKTQRHNWHTHVNIVKGDGAADKGRCASTGDHYNPFRVNVTGQYSECMLTNPLRCELGDQSNKLGTYDMGSGPMVASDVYLPLAGPYGVIGRSFVVHVEERGAPRLACADILPADHQYSIVLSFKKPPSPDREAMVQKIAQALDAHTYDVTVEFMSSENEDCQDSRVYFLGMDADMYLQNFTKMLDGDTSFLGIYRLHKECQTSNSGSTVLTSLGLLKVSLLLGRLLV